jgi:hypothetical protein
LRLYLAIARVIRRASSLIGTFDFGAALSAAACEPWWRSFSFSWAMIVGRVSQVRATILPI